MEGPSLTGPEDPNAGMIPRAVQQIYSACKALEQTISRIFKCFIVSHKREHNICPIRMPHIGRILHILKFLRKQIDTNVGKEKSQS